MKKVTKEQAEKALAEVARQLSAMNAGIDVPTGEQAAYTGDGPELRMEWDWPGEPTPTILLESSSFEEWALEIDSAKVGAVAGVFAEPYSSYALCLYPAYDRAEDRASFAAARGVTVEDVLPGTPEWEESEVALEAQRKAGG